MFRSALALLLWSSLLLLAGCQSPGLPVARHYIEDDHVSNYRRVFNVSPPEEIDVINSVVIVYNSKPGGTRTDDWAFELSAPASWISRLAGNMHLLPAEAVNDAVASINDRKDHPVRAWYAPKPITEYELYYLSITRVPYVHMLVDIEPEPDGRRRVFLSKQ
jgi:hypothetical protein